MELQDFDGYTQYSPMQSLLDWEEAQHFVWLHGAVSLRVTALKLVEFHADKYVYKHGRGSQDVIVEALVLASGGPLQPGERIVMEWDQIQTPWRGMSYIKVEWCNKCDDLPKIPGDYVCYACRYGVRN